MIHSTVQHSERHRTEPLLKRLLHEARQEDRDVREVLNLMGWGDLPEELVIEIKEDIRAFRQELEGVYSTCDPFVQKRRQRVDYWVRLFLAGDCRLETAVSALRVKSL